MVRGKGKLVNDHSVQTESPGGPFLQLDFNIFHQYEQVMYDLVT